MMIEIILIIAFNFSLFLLILVNIGDKFMKMMTYIHIYTENVNEIIKI